MKQIIQSMANRFGYRISKMRPRPECRYIDILDLVVRDYVARVSHDVVLLQVGANDGKRVDPVHEFIKRYGWRAILVEPEPRAFEELQKTYSGYPSITLDNCAIAPKDGEVAFFTVADDVDIKWTMLAQLDRARLMTTLVKQGFSRDESFIKQIKVPAYRLESLARRHGLEQIDVLQIDVEGFDYDIIKMVDFECMSPSIINFEHAHIGLDEQIECWEYLTKFGYHLAMVYGDTVAYRQA